MFEWISMNHCWKNIFDSKSSKIHTWGRAHSFCLHNRQQSGKYLQCQITSGKHKFNKFQLNLFGKSCSTQLLVLNCVRHSFLNFFIVKPLKLVLPTSSLPFSLKLPTSTKGTMLPNPPLICQCCSSFSPFHSPEKNTHVTYIKRTLRRPQHRTGNEQRNWKVYYAGRAYNSAARNHP